MELREDWENAIHGKQNDSARKDTIVVSATKGPKVENEKIENYMRKKGPRGRSLSEKLARKTCQDYMHGKCTKPSCDFWHFPKVSIAKNRRDAGSAISAYLYTKRLMVSPAKSRKSNVVKVLLLY